MTMTPNQQQNQDADGNSLLKFASRRGAGNVCGSASGSGSGSGSGSSASNGNSSGGITSDEANSAAVFQLWVGLDKVNVKRFVYR
jgi:hypothetical protein